MEYYDGMGNSKTQYVLELERRIKELEQRKKELMSVKTFVDVEKLDFVKQEEALKKSRKKPCQ